MEKEFVPYEQALALKELGFDEVCFGLYNPIFYIEYNAKNSIIDNLTNNKKLVCSTPLYQQAFRWFRENYDYDFGIGKIYNGNSKYHYHINLQWEYFEGSYEEAELELLKKLIEIVKVKS